MKLEASLYRDGTSQRRRLLAALLPDYFVVDDRTLHDFIQFAQECAKELRFYEDTPQTPTDWTGFLSTNKQFIEDAVRFIEKPEAIVDINRRAELMQPHRVLFWVFLLLLRYPQQQCNTLTRRYLEFYYRDCLQLQERPPQPDQAHVIFELAPFQQAHRLTKGTLLRTDDPDHTDTKAPLYRLDRDIMVSPAQVAKICALTLKKDTHRLATFYHPKKNQAADFIEMLQWVLTRALQQATEFTGDETPSIDIQSLNTLASQEQLEKQQQDYVLKKLAFPTVADFKKCLQWHKQSVKQQQIYAMMRQVYQKKITHQRYLALKIQHHRHPDFIQLLNFALGGSLPAWPGQHEAITAWKEDITVPVVIDYITQQLFMSVEDFRKAIDTVNDNPALNDERWREVYRLIERAQTKKEGYPDMDTEVMTDLFARVIWDTESAALKPFNVFDWPATHTHTTHVGFAIRSPLLFLREGVREITLTLDCQQDAFHPTRLNKLLQQAPFAFQLSGAETWLTPTTATVVAGSFLSGTALAEYAVDKLALMCCFKCNTGHFVEGDKDNYLCFEDGQLYQITQIISPRRARLRSVGFLPSKGTIKKYAAFTLTEAGHVLSGLRLEERPKQLNKNNVKKIKSETPQFTQQHLRQYILWTEGTAYSIERVVGPGEIDVMEYAYLPTLKSGEARVYHDIQLTETTILTDLAITRIAIKDGQFTEEDVGNVLVWEQGTLFTIQEIVTEQEVVIARVGQLPNTAGIRKYASDALFLNGLQFTFTLDDTVPAITSPQFDDDTHGLVSAVPMIKMTLNACRHYDVLKTLAVKKGKLAVSVKGVKDLTLRNDESLLTPDALLPPFGYSPTAHAGFYWAHPEICDKALDTLDLRITWSGLPYNFRTHYATYNQLLNKAIDNAYFQAQLIFVEGLAETAVGSPQRLFSDDLESKKVNTHTHLAFHALPKRRGTEGKNSLHNDPADDDPMTWPCYFKLALTEQDFLHDPYPTVLNKIALAKSTEGESVSGVYPPYTPLIRDFTLDYTASSTINLVDSVNHAANATHLFQLHPFGHLVLSHTVNPLLPQFSNAGHLYIGLKEAPVPTPLSLLFQLMPSKSDKLEDRVNVKYHYLDQDKWKAFDASAYASAYLDDKTDGLTRSGIILFHLPASASQKNTMMPPGLHWVCGTINQEVISPQIAAIKTQAASVTLAQEMHDEHYHKPLPAYCINQLVTADPHIKSVTQPYCSWGGRARENHHTFWQRTSERLRHKQRAISCWDYERLVLEAFPQLYKVKCLSQTQLQASPLAKVTVVVVPDSTHSASFLPLKPKAPRYLLEEIKAYLSPYLSPFVDLEVKNPRYEQIKYRVTVHFKKSCEQSYYAAKLNKAIKRFLSPWAYENTAEMTFGSDIHHSLLIHLIEKQPYVDYVTRLKLIEHIELDSDKTRPSSIPYPIPDGDHAHVYAPDAILVSAPKHLIDFDDVYDVYDDGYFEGIGYMSIGQDFIVH